MTRLYLSILILLFITPAFAVTTTPQQSEREALLKNLKSAKTEIEGQLAERALRRYWPQGPTPAITSQLFSAIYTRSNHDFENAIKIINKIIANAPEYAEAYNQRAFVYFLQRKYDKALEDIAKVLELEPKHFAALTGRAIIFLHQGRIKLARQSLQAAVDIHPWLKERKFLSRMQSIN